MNFSKETQKNRLVFTLENTFLNQFKLSAAGLICVNVDSHNSQKMLFRILVVFYDGKMSDKQTSHSWKTNKKILEVKMAYLKVIMISSAKPVWCPILQPS